MRVKKILVGFCLLLSVPLYFGCGLKTETTSQTKVEYQQGGRLTYGSLYEPDTLNPLLSDISAVSEVCSLVFSGLVQANDKGVWLPDLAVEVPTIQNGGISSDGMTVTYRLRHNVIWHDGAPFTANDVKFTWQVIMNPQVNVKSRDGYDKIIAVDVPDNYTVVLRFKEYYPAFLSLFTSILPQHILSQEADLNKAAFNRMPVGTGPFQVKDWRVGDAVLLEANSHYYRGKPILDGIVYKIIPDANLLIAQLKTGEIDIFSRVPISQLDQMKTVSSMKVLFTPNLIWEHMAFNLNNPLFQDVRIRQAIMLGLDRPALVSNVLKNAAVLAVADQPATSWAYHSDLQIPARNVNVAREILLQAGYKLGPDGIFAKDGRQLAFSVTTPLGNKIRETVLQAIAQQLKEVGVKVEPRLVEREYFFNEVLRTRNFDAALFALVVGADPDNYEIWNSKKIPRPSNGYDGKNYAGWNNLEVDSLTLQGLLAVNKEVRKQAYRRIQELILSDYPVVPLYFRANIDMVKNTVVHYQPNPNLSGNLWNSWEWALKK